MSFSSMIGNVKLNCKSLGQTVGSLSCVTTIFSKQTAFLGQGQLCEVLILLPVIEFAIKIVTTSSSSSIDLTVMHTAEVGTAYCRGQKCSVLLQAKSKR